MHEDVPQREGVAVTRPKRLEAPTFGQISRLVGSAVRKFEERFRLVTEQRLAAAEGVADRLDWSWLGGIGPPGFTPRTWLPLREVRLTLLAALCHVRVSEITDGLVDLLVQLVQKIDTRAEKKVEKEIIGDLKRVAGKTGILFRVAEAAVARPEGTVRQVIYPVAGEANTAGVGQGDQR